MPEDSPPNLKESLALYSRKVQSSGDTLFVPPTRTNLPEILVSPRGEDLLLGVDTFSDLLLQPQKRKVKKYTVGTGRNKTEVAVKIVDETAYPHTDLSGRETFLAVRALMDQGVSCATPITATDERYIAAWVKGKHADIKDPVFIEYLERLADIRDSLVSQRLWKDTWSVDYLEGNFKVGDVSSSDILKRFVAIDPIVNNSSIRATEIQIASLRSIFKLPRSSNPSGTV